MSTYTHTQPTKKVISKDLAAKGFDWGLYGVNWLKSNPTQISIQVSIGINGADNVRDFVIPTPASWDEEHINKELLKLPAFVGSKPI